MIAKCPFCDEYFGADLLDMHMGDCISKNRGSSGEFICSNCDCTFTNEHEFMEHKKTQHQEAVGDF
jgi:hypothetical protein